MLKASEKITPGQLSVALILAGLWLVLHTYVGIRHDAILYTGEALHVLNPDAFRRDIFFAFGSQSDFTIFPHVYAFAISLLGLKTGAFVLTAIGKLLWFWALFRLIQKVLPREAWIVGLGAVVLHSPYYDCFEIFSYGESFVSPRIFAETVLFFVLAACFEKRLITAFGLWGLGALVHPLMALPFLPLLCGLSYLGAGRFKPFLLFGSVVLIFVGITLALFHVRPLGDLLVFMDKDWWSVILHRCQHIPFGFVDGALLGKIAYLFLLAGIVAWYLRNEMSRLVVYVAVSTALFLMLWFLGTFVIHHALIAQLQLWRSVWLLQLLACISLGGLICHLWHSDSTTRALIPFLLAGFIDQLWTAFLFPLFGMLLTRWLSRQSDLVQQGRLWKLLPWLCLLPTVMYRFFSLVFNVESQLIVSQSGFLVGVVTYLVLSAVVIGSFGITVPGSSYWWNKVRAGFAVLALCFAALAWSGPYLHDTGDEMNSPWASALRARIPSGAIVSSNLNMRWVWTVLGRGNYGGFLPMTASVFSRPMAIEGWRRLLRMHEAHMSDSILDWSVTFDDRQRQVIADEHIRFLCADPVLDYLVLNGKYSGGEVFPVADSAVVSVFECAKVVKRRTES